MNYQWHDLLGNIGVLIILICYLLVHLDKIDTHSKSYSVANGVGAVFLCISLYISFNFSGLLMEFCWLLISIFGFYRSTKILRCNKTA